MPVVEHALLPAKDTKLPLLREHRLHQADWLLRFTASGGGAADASHPDFNLYGSQVQLGLRHLDFFPVEVNRATTRPVADPGVAVSAKRIFASAGPEADRGSASWGGDEAAQYSPPPPHGGRPAVHAGQPAAESDRRAALPQPELEQMSLLAPEEFP